MPLTNRTVLLVHADTDAKQFDLPKIDGGTVRGASRRENLKMHMPLTNRTVFLVHADTDAKQFDPSTNK